MATPIFSGNLNLTWGPRLFGKGMNMLFWGLLNGIFIVSSGADLMTTPIKMAQRNITLYKLPDAG